MSSEYSFYRYGLFPEYRLPYDVLKGTTLATVSGCCGSHCLPQEINRGICLTSSENPRFNKTQGNTEVEFHEEDLTEVLGYPLNYCICVQTEAAYECREIKA